MFLWTNRTESPPTCRLQRVNPELQVHRTAGCLYTGLSLQLRGVQPNHCQNQKQPSQVLSLVNHQGDKRRHYQDSTSYGSPNSAQLEIHHEINGLVTEIFPKSCWQAHKHVRSIVYCLNGLELLFPGIEIFHVQPFNSKLHSFFQIQNYTTYNYTIASSL